MHAPRISRPMKISPGVISLPPEYSPERAAATPRRQPSAWPPSTSFTRSTDIRHVSIMAYILYLDVRKSLVETLRGGGLGM